MFMEKLQNFELPNDHDKIAGLYNIGNTIGRGHYAVVKEAKHVFTQEKVAIKVIDKTKLDAQSREHLFSEVMCMKLVQHPNVVRLYEVIDTVNKLYLVLELGDAGDLYDYIMKYDNGLPEIQAKRYFRQIVQAIAYCHNLHVVHRDLKPENVVFFEKLELVKLTDFGFSNKFTPGQTLQTSCGSLAYSAPEILLGDAYDAPKVDIWSLGVILFMLVCGRLPFNEANDSETLSRIMDCRYELPTSLSESCQNLIRSMLIRVPEKRATLEQILSHHWMDRELLAQGDAFAVPLISQQHLSVEEHVDILTKMSEGKLASVEDIQVTLDRNEYSYITATYFLLAERKLKRQHYENFCKMKLLQLEAESKIEPPLLAQAIATISEKTEERIRRFSMILEDEEDEEEEEELEAMMSLASVREELVLTVGAGEGPSESGTSAPFNSRCCSRLSDHTEPEVVTRFNSQHSRCRSAIYSRYPSVSLSSIVHRHPGQPQAKHSHRASLPGHPSASSKRRSYPVLCTPSRSSSDVSSPPAPPAPLGPDWTTSSSSIDSGGSGSRFYPRRLRVKSAGSRPSSTGAALSLSDEEHIAMGTVVHASDVCAPIHEEEDELVRSHSLVVDGDDDDGDEDRVANTRLRASMRSASVETRLRSRPRLQEAPLVRQLSNFSLSSFASGLRDSRAMMAVVRGAFELQCLANRQAAAASPPSNHVHHLSCLHDDRVYVGTTTVMETVPEAVPAVVAIPTCHSSGKAVLAGHPGSLLLRASSTVGRKARFILSCCRTS